MPATYEPRLPQPEEKRPEERRRREVRPRRTGLRQRPMPAAPLPSSPCRERHGSRSRAEPPSAPSAAASAPATPAHLPDRSRPPAEHRVSSVDGRPSMPSFHDDGETKTSRVRIISRVAGKFRPRAAPKNEPENEPERGLVGAEPGPGNDPVARPEHVGRGPFLRRRCPRFSRVLGWKLGLCAAASRPDDALLLAT